MLHCVGPLLPPHVDAPGPVLRVRVPTAGQPALCSVHDARVGLALLLFYVLAHPRLALKQPANTRQDDEHWYWAGDRRAEPRVDVIREVLADAVVFYFCVRDPNVDLDLGVSRALQETRAPSAEAWRARVDLASSQAYYVQNFLQLPAAGDSVLMELNDPLNPAHLHRVLGLPDRRIVFAGRARAMPVLLQHPGVQLFLSLTDDQGWRQGLSDEQAAELCRTQAWAARGGQPGAAEPEEALDAVRRAPGTFDVLFAPWANVSPALRAVLQWSAAHPPLPVAHALSDATTSPFANMAQRFLHVLERDFHVAVLHKHAFWAFAASLGVYEFNYGLKHHMLFSGSSARGKSFVLDLLHRFWIPGSAEKVSYETKRANSTESNMNAMIVTHDEVSGELFKQGAGDPELKERLSSGRTSSRVFSTEGGRRKTQRVESKQQIVMIGLTNEPFDKLPEPVASRFACVEVEARPVRAGRELVDLLALPVDRAAQEAFIHEMRQVQAQVALVYTKIYVGLLPEVDMREALAAFGLVQARVKTCGLDIVQRDLQRLVLLARGLAIWSAVYEAWFDAQPTGVVGPVRCTREQALFCLTEASILNPRIKRVLRETRYLYDPDNFDYSVVKGKADPCLAELEGRMMGPYEVVHKKKPLRLYDRFIYQNVTAVLAQAVASAKGQDRVVVGWGGEPHVWLVV